MVDGIHNFSAVNRRVKSSVIRELLNLASRPGIISFAGGLPDPEVFPVEILKDIINKVLSNSSHVALQYGPTGGIPELKEVIVQRLKDEEKIKVNENNILITTASQQGLYLVGKSFLDAVDTVLVELPSYLGGLQVFDSFGAQMEGVASDEDGIILEDLEERIVKLREAEQKIKFIYVVPDFQNPSGVTLAQNRRKKLVRLASDYGLFVVEDGPYREIRFEGKTPNLLQKFQVEGNVISLFSFSKTLVPGFRIGYIVADEKTINKFSTLKQAIDLCSSPFNQLVIAEMLKSPDYLIHMENVKQSYGAKRDVMLKALSDYMPVEEGISWTKPEGGLFLWLKTPEKINCDELFHEAIKENVAYVIGSAFHCDGLGQNSMRLNFSFPTEEQIVEGIKRLSIVIKRELAKK